jgi:intraflagellar transport protein 88
VSGSPLTASPEAAIPFFSRASQIEPNEVKWRLMVASCYRRMGAYPAALKLYEDIHKSHPNDIECVRYLITICKDGPFCCAW